MRRALPAFLVLAACSHPKPEPAWTPGVSYATQTAAVYRGLLDRRGLIHAHNIHSHDACDGNPVDPATGAVNAACQDDFRGDVCKAREDFVFLTDHREMFATTEYPDTVMVDSSRGDSLVVRSGDPVANRAGCPDGSQILLIPGNEGTNLMPVGLETHVGDEPTRWGIYGTSTDPSTFPANTSAVEAAIAADHAHGAVVLVAHPEGLSQEELATFPIDGFEMYNLHANALFTNEGLAAILTLITDLTNQNAAGLPTNPNTAFLSFFDEDPRYLQRWAYALSQGTKRVTTLGSDCHENAIPPLMSDGERGDRYRRVMQWFSNHLLVRPNADGTWDDLNLKEALSAGRLYGAFEALGYPVGFDYHAETPSGISEMGDSAPVGSTLVVTLPRIEHLDVTQPAPAITVRILRADGTSWDEVANGPASLRFTTTQPGAYRAEIRMVPHHLEAELGPVARKWMTHDFVWIYANAIYVN